MIQIPLSVTATSNEWLFLGYTIMTTYEIRSKHWKYSHQTHYMLLMFTLRIFSSFTNGIKTNSSNVKHFHKKRRNSVLEKCMWCKQVHFLCIHILISFGSFALRVCVNCISMHSNHIKCSRCKHFEILSNNIPLSLHQILVRGWAQV